jgi:hypothetical protein
MTSLLVSPSPSMRTRRLNIETLPTLLEYQKLPKLAIKAIIYYKSNCDSLAQKLLLAESRNNTLQLKNNALKYKLVNAKSNKKELSGENKALKERVAYLEAALAKVSSANIKLMLGIKN